MLISILLKNNIFVPAVSIDDLLKDDSLIPTMLIIFFVIMIIALPVGIAMSKKANNDIYGSDEYDEIKTERNAKIIARRSTPHPMNASVLVNMVVFELENGIRVELAIKDPNTYGIMVEGDCGTLKYQGKRFISFVRGQ